MNTHPIGSPGDSLTHPESDDGEPRQCPECGVADEAFSLHEADCPSGYPAKNDPELDSLQQATREYEDA